MGSLKNASLMKHLMDNIKDNIYFMDREGRIILINNEGAKWLGFKSPISSAGHYTPKQSFFRSW